MAKVASEAKPKATKAKKAKDTEETRAEKAATPKEPELTTQEKLARKEVGNGSIPVPQNEQHTNRSTMYRKRCSSSDTSSRRVSSPGIKSPRRRR